MIAKDTRGLVLALLGLVIGALACESTEVKQCRAQYLATHAIVQATDPNDLDNVEETLKAVKDTTAVCVKAQLHEELDQLKGVQRKLESNSEYLHRYGTREELTSAQLEALVKKGDPGCPKGQAYNYRKTEKQVRCTGPQPVTMNWKEAKQYFQGRAFKLSEDGAKLRAEYGSESYVFHFKSPADSHPPTCVEVFAAPGIPWEESVARFTGARVQTIKEGKPIKAPSGTLPIVRVEDQTQAIYKLGECP